MGTLTSQQQEHLLVELLQDCGRVELARAMLQRSDSNSQALDEPPQASPLGQQHCPGWCKCGRCCHMENPVERLCCKMRTCITMSETFHDVVQNRNVLSVCIIDRGDYTGEDPVYTPASY